MVAAAKRSRKTNRLTEGTPLNPKWVKVSDFAKHFAMSVSGVHKAIGAGTIRTIPVPGTGGKLQRRIPYSEIERIESGKPLPAKKG